MLRSGIIQFSLVFMILGFVGLSGCAHQYVMKLSDGDQIISYSKPRLEGGSYHFTDSLGGKHAIPQNRVVKLRPVSVVNEKPKPAPADSGPKPVKRKHWYFLWLA